MTRRKRILVMDDSRLVLEMTRFALEKVGFEVTTVSKLEELELERDGGDHDLILMDVQMPEAYGDDVAMVLRSVRDVAIPIVLFSAIDATELARRAAEAEVEAFVPKREGVAAVVARIQAILAAGVDDVTG